MFAIVLELQAAVLQQGSNLLPPKLVRHGSVVVLCLLGLSLLLLQQQKCVGSCSNNTVLLRIRRIDMIGRFGVALFLHPPLGKREIMTHRCLLLEVNVLHDVKDLFGREETVIRGIVKVDGRRKHNGTVYGVTLL